MATMSSPPADLFASTPLQKAILVPGDAGYIKRQDSYWSSTSKAEPACIVSPTSADEVSAIVKTLVSANQQFAVRSGGHTQWYGANNIRNGVQIDLCFLAWVKLDESTETVDLGPGAHWEEVYAELEKYGHMVAGGRNGKVGVGGLLLGGGKTFFTGRRGFACDDVLAYEVVLADGRIVTADASTNPDLFFALKGGSSNFGIVTNFKMRSFKNDKIWAGLRILPKETTDAALQALQDFTAHASEDLDSNLLVFLAKMGSCKVNSRLRLNTQ
nr:bifunctional solanapyrone synthase [Quercus suber]